MDHLEEISEVTDSDIDNHVSVSYLKLQRGEHVIKQASGTYRCPFCARKKKQVYFYKDIVRHAYSVGASNRHVKVKANHRALLKYLTKDMAKGADQSLHYVVLDQEPVSNTTKDEDFVWPWMGVLVNIPTEIKDGRCIGNSIINLKSHLSQFNPLKIHPLWNFKGHTGSAIIKFRKDWSGFKDAMTFDKHFEREWYGRNDWYGKELPKDGLYGWFARAEDYNLDGPIGRYLRKHGDLKTVHTHEKEGFEKNMKLVADLTDQLVAKNALLRELECGYNECKMSLNQMMEQKDQLHCAYNEEMRKMQNILRDQRHHFLDENQELRLQLETTRKELELHSKEIVKLRNLLRRRERREGRA